MSEMLDQVRLQTVEMQAKGFEPAAIIMTPNEMRRFLSAAQRDELAQGSEGSGWTFQGLPLWRSWEISGPTVVSREVLRVLRREYRTHWVEGGVDEAPSRAQTDLLF